MSYVKVAWAENEINATLIKGALVNEGIDSTISPLNDGIITSMLGYVNSSKSSYGVYVKQELEKEALEVLRKIDKIK